MLPLKLRLKILNKLAQAVPGSPASPASPTSPTSPNAPTTPSSTQAAIIPPPPAFTASGAWGWMGNVYNSASVGFIDELVKLFNLALHYSSQGQHNWQTLRNNGFNVDPSGEKSVDAKNLLNLSKLIYSSYLNSGNQFPAKVTGSQVATWNNDVLKAQSYLNLSQLSSTGEVARKIPGNLKDNIANILRQLAQYNPVQPQQSR
jgi:hypothetical protein